MYYLIIGLPRALVVALLVGEPRIIVVCAELVSMSSAFKQMMAIDFQYILVRMLNVNSSLSS